MDLKRVTVLSPSFALTSIVAVSSALAKIGEAFPDASVSAVQSLTTLPSLIAIPVILLSGSLCSVTTKKRIVAASMGLMLAGGLMPLALHRHFWQLVAAAVVFGVGYGGISPLTTALIHEHYSASEQPAMLGFQSAVIGVGGVLFSFLGGQLAAARWWYVYFTYLLFVPILALVLMLPKGETDKPRKGEKLRLFSPALLFYVAQAIVFCVFLYIFQTNIAMLIEEKGLGGAEAAGKVLAFQSAASIVSGILGGRILSRLKEFSLPVIFLGVAAALLAVYFSGSLYPMFFAALVLGFFFAIRMPAGYLKATASVGPAAATMAIAIYCSSSQVGQFLSPLAVNWMSGLMGLSLNGKFLFGGISILVLAAVSVLWELALKKRRPEGK